jgi:hypothetical protein
MTTNKSGSLSLSRCANSFHSSDFSGFNLLGVTMSQCFNVSMSLVAVLIIFSHISNHLPAGLSHCVTTPTISNLLSLLNSCKKFTPIGADEKNTTL